MANVKPTRRVRNTRGTIAKRLDRREEHDRTPEAYLEAIQKNGWAPELEADLLRSPSFFHSQPRLMEILLKEAGQRRDAKLWRVLAELCERSNDNQTAATYATEALHIQPDDVTAMGVLARLCAKRQAEADAANWHRQILVIDPTQFISHRFLSQLHYHRGEYEAALPHLAQLIEAEPKVRTNKLYWLLAKVKSVGIPGLAQPLTDVRRWRTFTPEETQLAHELFLLVAKQCVLAKQHERAKQYLTRAMQLAPTPEGESLLAEVSVQPPTTKAGTKPPRPPSRPPVVIRSEYRPVPLAPPVFVPGARTGRSRIIERLTSGVGIIVTTVVVSLLAIWNIPYAPHRRAFHSLQQEDSLYSPEKPLPSSVPKQEVIAPKTPLSPQQPETITAAQSPSVPSPSPEVALSKPEAKKVDTPPPLSQELRQKPAAVSTPTAEPQPQRHAAQSVPSKVATNTVLPQQVVPPPLPKINVPGPASTKAPVPQPSLAVVEGGRGPVPAPNTEVRSPIPSASPKVTEIPSTPVPPVVSLGEAPKSPALPTVSAPTEKVKGRPKAPKPSSGQTDSLAKTDVLAVKEQIKEKAVGAVGGQEDSLPVPANPELVEAAGSFPSEKSVNVEEVQAYSPTTPVTTESVVTAESLPTSGESEPKIISEVDLGGQIPSPSADSQTPQAKDDPSKEDDHTAPVDENTSASGAEDPSSRIARLSSRLPYASQFPIRERLVQIPPEKLLPTMKELMKQETGDSTVRHVSRRILRARVSGKKGRSRTRAPKSYGQYLVEVMPGPTEGTSRVRTKVLMFNWQTGQPVDDADSLADRFLDKITE